MKKVLIIITSMLIVLGLLTGCGCSKKVENKNETSITENQTVIDNQIYEGLEFVNVGVKNGVVRTIVINNTGVTYEGSKFSMKIKDSNGNVIVELIDSVYTKMETGTTKTIETKTNVDLSNATSIEYSIIK